MANKRHKPDEIVTKLRQVEVLRGQGMAMADEALAIRIDRKLNSTDVIDVLSDLFILRGVPEHVRSDNGPEFIATAVQDWITAVGAKTAYIAPGSPWENGYIEIRAVESGEDEVADRDRCQVSKIEDNRLQNGPAGQKVCKGEACRARYPE